MRLVSLFHSSLSAQIYQMELKEYVERHIPVLSLKQKLKFWSLLRKPKDRKLVS